MGIEGIESIASRAGREPVATFSTLMHHFTEESIRGAYLQVLEGNKAPGVGGVTDGEIRVRPQRPENTAGHMSQMGCMSCDADRVTFAEVESTSGS